MLIRSSNSAVIRTFLVLLTQFVFVIEALIALHATFEEQIFLSFIRSCVIRGGLFCGAEQATTSLESADCPWNFGIRYVHLLAEPRS